MSIPIPEGSVIITPTEVYKEVVGTHQAVQSLSAKVDLMASDLNRRVGELDGPDGEIKELKRESEEIGKRVSSLERWRWIITGGVTTLGSAGGIAIYQAFSSRH